jgi:hypothetical protein
LQNKRIVHAAIGQQGSTTYEDLLQQQLLWSCRTPNQVKYAVKAQYSSIDHNVFACRLGLVLLQ